MPEYFYHIGIELFDHRSSSPVDLSRAFQALNPFVSQQPRAARDHKFDSMRSSHSSRPSLSTRSPMRTVPSSLDDKRIDHVIVDAVDGDDITPGIGTSLASARTRAAFAITEESDAGELGIVHLYRDADETPGLYQNTDRIPSTHLWDGSATARARSTGSQHTKPPKHEDCTILSILAVPSYMTPKDFLAYVGKDTRNAVSHFRMIRTSRLNRYMVLIKFKDGRFARQWQHDWNGKVFNSMEPETCHVVFVKSVEVLHNQDLQSERDVSDQASVSGSALGSRSALASLNKPAPPPTPALVELPTCPVCLERMDESTGLLTVLCQHVFHCSCLEKWSGGGCPVCRYCHDDFSTATSRPNTKKKYDAMRGEFEIQDEDDLECGECRITQSLWQCLICGYVGCGRYAGKHAYHHYERTGHTFSLDLESQRVWDYDRDCYVHRIIANGSTTNGEKLVELPGRRSQGQVTALQDDDQDLDIAKRENLAFEYTQLLTSQLESQRIYFEEVVARAVDKATDASKRAEKAVDEANSAVSRLDEILADSSALKERYEQLMKTATRYEAKSQKLEEQKKELEKEHQDTKALLDSIYTSSKANAEKATADRNKIFKQQAEKIQKLEEDNATKAFYLESLQEEVGSLRAQLAGQDQLQQLVNSGQLTKEELEGATISMGPAPSGSIKPTSVSRSRKLRHINQPQPLPMPRKDPTDDEIRQSIANTKTIGTVGSLLMSKIGKPTFVYTSHATEGDIIRTMTAKGIVVKNRQGDFELKGKVRPEDIVEGLQKENLITINPEMTIGEMVAESHETALMLTHCFGLNKGYELAKGKDEIDVARVLIDGGVWQKKEEEGLYDSDATDENGENKADGGGKAQKKNKKKNKKKK
ncbi:hypothetical protein LTR70_008896 [Exophiala xenobiotica]|uniref:Uncharacterized protein n=1 Tax=Lithohypha guttulata TaxID=1690604 RepID=A0ABR0JYJ7_9EURO|nr:hypothetical protein LTR24_008889 [Lithohypha guttulata]KAK5311257.1 hypothetical protein LTR70_008896 [Exophiala xenobiotica]